MLRHARIPNTMQAQFSRAWTWVGLLGLIATGLVGGGLSLENERRLGREMERQAQQVAQQVEARFGLYEYGLRGARGAGMPLSTHWNR